MFSPVGCMGACVGDTMLKLNVHVWHSSQVKGGFYSVMQNGVLQLACSFFAQLWKLNSHAH